MFGAIELSIAAALEDAGSRDLAGTFLAIWSAGSLRRRARSRCAGPGRDLERRQHARCWPRRHLLGLRCSCPAAGTPVALAGRAVRPRRHAGAADGGGLRDRAARRRGPAVGGVRVADIGRRGRDRDRHDRRRSGLGASRSGCRLPDRGRWRRSSPWRSHSRSCAPRVDATFAGMSAHPWMANSTAAAKQSMLDAIGAASIDELFEQIPADHRTAPAARPRAGAGLGDRAAAPPARARSARNGDCESNLSLPRRRLLAAPRARRLRRDRAALRVHHLGAGARAQSDKGRNQAWFEFTSQLAELVDMDFVGLPVYTWGAAGGHAIRMAARLTGRNEVLVPGVARPRAPGRDPHLLRAARDARPHRRSSRSPSTARRPHRRRRPRGARSPTAPPPSTSRTRTSWA